MPHPLFALILAGGSGERFWPLSRKTKPKQLLSLFGGRTLLEDTIARLDGLVPRENILVLTNRDQESATRELLHDLPADNILAEPAKRDTAAAVALGVGLVSRRDAAGTMIILPADHLIRDTVGFQSSLRLAAAAARDTGELVTIGIKPTWACPGFGYIEVGKPLTLASNPAAAGLHEVIRFREKPNPQLAADFLRQGNFRWNAGMFIWTIPAILAALDRHAPPLSSFVENFHQASDIEDFLTEHFYQLPKISVDYAILEKAERVLMVEAGFDWDDVGGWIAVSKYLEQCPGHNAANAPLLVEGAENNIVFSDKPRQVVLMGVHDLIVVQTSDALLVCRRSEAESIKAIIPQLPKELQ